MARDHAVSANPARSGKTPLKNLASKTLCQSSMSQIGEKKNEHWTKETKNHHLWSPPHGTRPHRSRLGQVDCRPACVTTCLLLRAGSAIQVLEDPCGRMGSLPG